MTMSTSKSNLQSLLTYISSVRGLMRESAKMLDHFAEPLCPIDGDAQEAEALIARRVYEESEPK